jgi:hypothetical protein
MLSPRTVAPTTLIRITPSEVISWGSRPQTMTRPLADSPVLRSPSEGGSVICQAL